MDIPRIDDKDQWVLRVDLDGIDQWVSRVNRDAQYVRSADTDDITSRLKKCSIYRLPARVVNQNKEAYLPQWVSLGPYHHGEEHLKPMEEHKHRALLYALKRSNQNLGAYIRAVKQVADDLLDSYQSIDPYWKEHRGAFVKLMILDGCFLLEILRKWRCHSKDYPPSDPIFGIHGDHHVYPYITCDILMLENQLPLLLLEKLAAVETQGDVKFVHNLILNFCTLNKQPDKIMEECLHMLHLSQRVQFQQPNSREISSSSDSDSYPFIGRATELSQAGIVFQRKGTLYLDKISFSNGILTLPIFCVAEESETLLLNILAFERFHVGAGSNVTSYVHFMSSIIKDVKDVTILNRERIIINNMGNETTTVQLFNSISKDMAFNPVNDLYGQVRKNIAVYRNSGWPRFRSSLIATYIREWPVLSAAAAAFLFILTITQTVYTVYSVYHK